MSLGAGPLVRGPIRVSDATSLPASLRAGTLDRVRVAQRLHFPADERRERAAESVATPPATPVAAVSTRTVPTGVSAPESPAVESVPAPSTRPLRAPTARGGDVPAPTSMPTSPALRLRPEAPRRVPERAAVRVPGVAVSGVEGATAPTAPAAARPIVPKPVVERPVVTKPSVGVVPPAPVVASDTPTSDTPRSGFERGEVPRLRRITGEVEPPPRPGNPLPPPRPPRPFDLEDFKRRTEVQAK